MSTTSTAPMKVPTLDKTVQKYNKDQLITFLQRQPNFKLDEEDLNIITREKMNGRTFFGMTEEKLKRYSMKDGPATDLVLFIKNFKK